MFFFTIKYKAQLNVSDVAKLVHNRPKDFVCHLKMVSYFFHALFRAFLFDSVNSFDKMKLLLVSLKFFKLFFLHAKVCEFVIPASSSSCLFWLRLMIKSVFRQIVPISYFFSFIFSRRVVWCLSLKKKEKRQKIRALKTTLYTKYMHKFKPSNTR